MNPTEIESRARMIWIRKKYHMVPARLGTQEKLKKRWLHERALDDITTPNTSIRLVGHCVGCTKGLMTSQLQIFRARSIL